MATKVVISTEAQNLLNEVIGHLEEESYSAHVVGDFKKRVLNLIDLLSVFPKIGRKLDGKLTGYRTVHIRKYHYVFLYRHLNGIVYVERVYHMSQDYESLVD